MEFMSFKFGNAEEATSILRENGYSLREIPGGYEFLPSSASLPYPGDPWAWPQYKPIRMGILSEDAVLDLQNGYLPIIKKYHIMFKRIMAARGIPEV